jgi:hypothetical protein
MNLAISSINPSYSFLVFIQPYPPCILSALLWNSYSSSNIYIPFIISVFHLTISYIYP